MLRPAPLLAAFAAFACFAAFASPAAAQGKTDDRVLIFVDEVQTTDKALQGDATALTTALCAALGKDKRVDVLCAPDVKQILNFAATAAMIGTAGGPGGALQDRLDRTKHVVATTYRKEGGNFVLVVKAGPKAAEAQAAALYSEKPVIALEEKGDQQRKLLDKLPQLAARVTAALVDPAGPPPPPPAPLEKAEKAEKPEKAKPAGGW
jgi:hypothetical protein